MAEEVKELDPSPDSEIKDQDEHAQSSSAESETEEDLLSVVQDAMQPSEDADSQSDEEYDEDDDDGEYEHEDGLAADDADESFEDVPFHKHPRFKEVIDQRNKYREGAEQYEQITSFLSQNNLSAEEAAQGFQIMALMKNDPAAALEALNPFVQQLGVQSGITMPGDIQSKVEDGYLDEDAGRELSRLRAEAARERQMREQMQGQQQQQQAQAQLHNLAATVTDWEERTRASDPDYDLKQDEIDDRVRVLVTERGRPQTPEQAIAMAKEAYDSVNERYKARFGNKRQIRTASGGKLGGTPQAEPTSLMEAVQNALGETPNRIEGAIKWHLHKPNSTTSPMRHWITTLTKAMCILRAWRTSRCCKQWTHLQRLSLVERANCL